jgi:hypothetical protein
MSSDTVCKHCLSLLNPSRGNLKSGEKQDFFSSILLRVSFVRKHIVTPPVSNTVLLHTCSKLGGRWAWTATGVVFEYRNTFEYRKPYLNTETFILESS